MPLNTDLNVSPYYDDFDERRGFAKILFKPGVAVQVRELNQLQSIINNQIENFGNNLLKRGTIIEGCSLTYFSVFPYVKIKDIETNGAPVNVSSYEGLTVRNSNSLEALIVKTADGFESQAPDLNTLFVKYLNSGQNGNTSTFSADQVLTVYDKAYPIFSYNINDGSTNFSNTDTLTVISSLAIQNSSGGTLFPAGAFANGIVIQNGVANLQIIEANTTANSKVVVLRVKPLAEDLKTANSVLWTFRTGETIRNANGSTAANVVAIVGIGATASLFTDSLGKIVLVTPTNLGSGYYVLPHVTVSIASNSAITTSQINQLDVKPTNFKASVYVAENIRTPIGTGYGVKIAPGVIYQKGFFSRVTEQTLVVNKYSNTGFDAVVGFDTKEEIINSSQDNSLFDNATGTQNFSAPGADRIKLTPNLVVLTPAESQANNDFLPIIEITDGVPFRQKTQTVYNVIADEMAKRTYEESGNYVINQFNVLAKDEKQLANTASTFKVVVDPGTAYIKGYRVSTSGNFSKSVDKGTETVNVQNATSRVAYGSFIKIKNVGGIFRFNFGDTISLYDTVKDFIIGVSNGSNAITAPSGSVIGQARIRGMLPGDNDGEWHLYLFDIKMEAGKNFVDTRSVYYNNTLVAVADTVLESNNTILRDVGSGFNGLIVKGLDSTKSANNITYTYRTFDTNKTSNTTGYITLGGQDFPYSGTLGSSQKKEFMVIPKSNYQAQVNAAGVVSFNSTTSNVTGSGTSFLTSYRAGDYIKVVNNATSAVAKILNIANNTFLTLTANAPLTISNTSYLYFPNNVPISMTRDLRSVIVETNNSITIYLGNTIANTTGSATNMDVAVAYNVRESGVSPEAKLIKRGVYSRIICSTNAAKTTGPWPLGVGDVFRMRQVLIANGASRAITVNAETAVSNTNDFITISSNPFANGDSLLYSNTGANGVIGGLANNTPYFVVEANSTGVKLSSTRNSSAIDLTAVSDGGNHTLTGAPIYFAETTNGVTDVTNEFYIDHRQNEDILDISHLIRKPELPALSNNDVILIKYDMFTTTPGVKTATSYSTNDGQTIDVMANAIINTVEIPEVWGINGDYYDLRDQFDFRPTAANTIPITSEVSNTSIVNPTLPTFSNKLTASEKKFPISDTDLTANVVYYQGRTDRVVVSKSGSIDVIKGVAGRTEPVPAPSDTITLQLLEIPPYPSLPKLMSQNMIRLADTKIYNNGKASKRIFDYTISTPIDANQREVLQNRNYKMEDIASLEKRISDIEYYVSYTLAESLAKARFIPSSLSPGSDRFKVGFFVDPFSNYQYSEVLDPEFNSTIEDEKLTARIDETVIELKHETSPNIGGSVASVDYVEVTAYKQMEVTQLDPPPSPPPPPPSPTPTPTPVTVSGGVLFRGFDPSIDPPEWFNATTGEFRPPPEAVAFWEAAGYTIDYNAYTSSPGQVVNNQGLQRDGSGRLINDIVAWQRGELTGPVIVYDPDLLDFRLLDEPLGGFNSSRSSNLSSGTVSTQQIVSELKSNKTTSWGTTSPVFEEWYFGMSYKPGPVEIYMNHRSLQNAISVEQSEGSLGPWTEITNSGAATGVTSADINEKGLSGLLDSVGFNNPGTTLRMGAPTVPGTSIFWFKDHQKLIFNHDPTKGIYYRIIVYKGDATTNNVERGRYEYKIFYPADYSLPKTNITKNPDRYSYEGEFVSLTPKNITIGGSNINDPNNNQVFYDQGMENSISISQLQNNLNSNYWWTNGCVHKISIIGLKPYTYHDAYFDGTLCTDKCEQLSAYVEPLPGGVFQTITNTTGLRADQNGSLVFNFYNDMFVDWSLVDTTFAQDQIRTGTSPSDKSLRVVSLDSSSEAQVVITIAPWLRRPEMPYNLDTGQNNDSAATVTLVQGIGRRV